MKKAVVLICILCLCFGTKKASESTTKADSLKQDIKGFVEIPLFIVPAGFYSPFFPDQALTPHLNTMHFLGGSYAYYPGKNVHFAPELRFQNATFFNDWWDRPYRPNVIPGDDAEISISSDLTVLSLGIKYSPHSWKSSLRPFASVHIGRAWMRNTLSVTDCDEDDNDEEMLERFLKQNSYVYNLEAGLEYDFGNFLMFLSLNYMASWDDFEYYDFDSLEPVRETPASKTFIGRDEFRSDIVEFHKEAPRYRGPLSMFGARIGFFWRLGI